VTFTSDGLTIAGICGAHGKPRSRQAAGCRRSRSRRLGCEDQVVGTYAGAHRRSFSPSRSTTAIRRQPGSRGHEDRRQLADLLRRRLSRLRPEVDPDPRRVVGVCLGRRLRGRAGRRPRVRRSRRRRRLQQPARLKSRLGASGYRACSAARSDNLDGSAPAARSPTSGRRRTARADGGQEPVRLLRHRSQHEPSGRTDDGGLAYHRYYARHALAAELLDETPFPLCPRTVDDTARRRRQAIFDPRDGPRSSSGSRRRTHRNYDIRTSSVRREARRLFLGEQLAPREAATARSRSSDARHSSPRSSGPHSVTSRATSVTRRPGDQRLRRSTPAAARP